MNRMNLLNALQFDYELTSNEKVQSKVLIEVHSVIDDGKL